MRVSVGATVTAVQGDKVYVTLDNGLEQVYHKRDITPSIPRRGKTVGVTQTVVHSRVAQAFEIELIDEVLNGLPEGWFYIV